MSRSLLLTSVLLALRAVAQSASPYIDAKTGITFNGYHHTSGYTLGIALPENPTTDFIAQIQAPITDGAGWAGFSMGQSMVGNLLVVAWPNNGEIVSSFREATGYTSPGVAASNFTMLPIPDGTFVNDTAFSYTFLCSRCISNDVSKGLVIYESPSMNIMGWAFSKDALTNPAVASSSLTYHTAGFGAFGLPMDKAKSPDFEKWAALAQKGPGHGPGNSTLPDNGNSTAPVTGGNSTTPIGNTAYDYIVAGGGASGIIAAARIAESGASVLLIERGGPSYASTGNTNTQPWNNTVSMYDVPGYAYYLSDVGSPAYCTDTADMAGCVLGGGTAVNAMMFVKPQERDFDDKWPSGWKWKSVSSAADRVWKRNPGQTYGAEDGTRYDDEAFNVLSKFFGGHGWTDTDFIENPNSKVDVFGHPPWNIADGLRSGVVRTYLPVAQKLPNFTLMLNTKVIRAVRNGSSITGIEVENESGDRIIYHVNKGGSVLLAAGSLSTPRILFNSGIGPLKQLQTVASGTSRVTLPAKAEWIDLPVGAEIKDHPIFTVKFSTKTNFMATPKTAFTKPDQSTAELFAKGSGLLAQSGQRLNWWSSITTSDGSEVFFQGTCNAPSDNTIQMKIYTTHGSQSVGSLGITADGATEFITSPHMTSKIDAEAVTLMMNRLLSMSKGENSTISIKTPTGAANVTAADLVQQYKSGSHYVGSAKMGTKGEPGVVVDTNTKVYGTNNLFVIDASMHPDLPTGNTQAIVMVAAEAAAARILALGTNKGPSSNETAPAAVPEPTCVASATPTDSPLPNASSPVPSATPVASPPAAVPKPGREAQPYSRCGGHGYTGSSQCSQGWKCVKQNDYYSQCLTNTQATQGRSVAIDFRNKKYARQLLSR